MADLEDLIRDSMRLYESHAPDPSGLMSGVASRERTRRRRTQGAGAAGIVAVVAGVLLAATMVGHQTQVRPGSATATHRAVGTVAPAPSSSTPPGGAGGVDVCGTWSAENSAFAEAVATRYGPIGSCFRYGDDPKLWVITTDGVNGGRGFIGVDQCNNDIDCYSGAHDHGSDLWAYYPADRAGAVRLYAAPVAGQPLQVTVGGRQETFDVNTNTFGPQAGAAATARPSAARALRRVLGHLRVVGGPSFVSPHGVAGTVTFHRSDGADISFAAGSDGAWVASLTYGTYTVTGSSPDYGSVCVGDAITADNAGPTGDITVACNIR